MILIEVVEGTNLKSSCKIRPKWINLIFWSGSIGIFFFKSETVKNGAVVGISTNISFTAEFERRTRIVQVVFVLLWVVWLGNVVTAAVYLVSGKEGMWGGVEMTTGFVSWMLLVLGWESSKVGGCSSLELSISVGVFSCACIEIALAEVDAGKDSPEVLDCALVMTIGGTEK